MTTDDATLKGMTLRKHVLIDYTNHAGVRRVRQIAPRDNQFYFGNTEWHPESQWLLDAYDVQKDDLRTFAVKDIHRWGVDPGRQMDIDLSLAAQLQRSMELNARMKARLLEYRKVFIAPDDDVVLAIDSILKDEDPACFKGTD